ncbi:MAG: 23S rRNA pseudouridine(1911/1915/1917) synthase RluD, partial [Psychrosphaera sp.]|nr:23S rRNA pseudouridine(1911/1915/1917) synthase RluD [Psychrosphaera sp.]
MSEHVSLAANVPDLLVGKRLDQAIAEMFPDFSRMRLKDWILAGHVSVDGKVITKPRVKLIGGEDITIEAEIEEAVAYAPEDIPIDIVYEDDYILVVNKPTGLVVHPGAGNSDGTLLNALLFHYPEIVHVARAGIVHRLDKDTTGLMVVAKTVEAQTHLVTSLQARQITREYEAICTGTLTGGGMVDKPIGRHPTKRTHMAVNETGKDAITHYR